MQQRVQVHGTIVRSQLWMERSICGIGVVSVVMRVESFQRSIEISSEREKLGKGYWVLVIFFFFASICN